MVRILISLWCVLMAFSCFATSRLDATVDRTKIYENETLNLQIRGDLEMEFGLGGLMNFGRNMIDSPTLEGLDKDFDILDQQQSSNMQIINGQSKAQVTWSYTLAPKRSGILTIPSAKLKDAESQLLAVEVIKGSAPKKAGAAPMVYIEAEVDKQEAYVQEQVLYTLRLFSAQTLAGGDLSVPAPTDAIVEVLGETKKYYRMAHNQRYEVRERKYLLFPQKSGELTIEPQNFSGTLIDSRTHRRQRINELSSAVTVKVKAPPSQFSGRTWLPAVSFELSEKWDKEPDQLIEGESITRTLELSALGLLGSALPPIGMDPVPGLKAYPDQPVIESYQHESGAQSLRRESTALVAISPNTTTLPEISIPWWDTVNDVERVAVIPARTLAIKPNPETQSLRQNKTSPQSAAENLPSATNSGDKLNHPDQNSAPLNSQPWYLLIALLLIGWLSTLVYFLRRTQSVPAHDQQKFAAPVPGKLYQQLLEAIKKDQADMPKLLVLWVQEHSRAAGADTKIISLSDLLQVDQTLYQQAIAFEQQRYGKNGSTSNGAYDKRLFLEHVKRLANAPANHTKTSALRPFYP